MNKKYLLLVILVCLAGIYGFTIINNDDVYNINGSDDVARISAIAIEKQDASECAKIRTSKFNLSGTSVDFQDECYSITAKTLKDKNTCEKLSTDRYKQNCYLDMAYILNDVSVCNFTGEYLGMCYGNLASKSKNSKICENIFEESHRNRCFIEVNKVIGNKSICDNKINTTKDKDYCYFATVQSFTSKEMVLKPDIKNICENIKSEEIHKECIIYYTNSVANYR
jgi:hypothetical protein